jgi:hypothetical protein
MGQVLPVHRNAEIIALIPEESVEPDPDYVPDGMTREEYHRCLDEQMCDFYGYPHWVLDGPFPHRQIDGHI